MSYLENRITIQSKIDSCKKAIKKSPKNPNLYNSLAILYEKAGAFDEALHYYKEAIRCDVKFVKAYNNIGVVLYKQGRYKAAVEMFKLSLGVDDKFVSTYVNLGAACNKAKIYKEGEEALLKAIELDSDNSGAYANLGNIYNKMKRYDEARINHEMALNLDDKSASNHANIGITYKNLGEYEKAKKSLLKAIEIDANFVNAHFDLATTYLTLGEYKKGFKEYEWRFQKPEMRGLLTNMSEIFKKPKFTLKSKKKDKTLLLYSEQGFGDILQFVRFGEVLKNRYPTLKLKLQVRDELKTLLASIDCFDEVISRKDSVGEFDYQLALLSLPHLLKTTLSSLPSKKSYIRVVGETSFDVDKEKLNIGIVWGASTSGDSYEDKVFSLKYFKPLMDDEDIELYSLQVGGDVKEIKEVGYESIIDLEWRLSDFRKTALIIEKLDLVITSDTSVAHLAGAMGKDVWVVLQKNADWRWGVKGNSTPWYKSAKLFRQDKQGDWDSAFSKVYNMIQKRKK